MEAPSVADALRWANVRTEEEKKPRPKQIENIQLFRQKMPARDEFMGKVFRNFVTGEIALKKVSPNTDFRIVDLYRRSRVIGTPENLAADPYLFKPVIMPMRTWIYHDLHRSKKLLSGTDENGMVKYVMNTSVIDANIATGHFSPLVCYMPGVLFCALTKDQNTVGSSVLVAATMCVVGNMTNYSTQYRMARYYTIPIRMIHVLIVLLSFFNTQSDDLVAFVGFLLTFASIILDIVNGDYSKLTSFRFWSYFETVRELPRRVFLCRRVGAAHLEETQGFAREIDVKIHGMGTWQKRRWMMCCELCGVICRLEPISKQEWVTMWEASIKDGTVYTYVGLDLFDDKKPATDPFDETQEEKMMKRKKATSMGIIIGTMDEPVEELDGAPARIMDTEDDDGGGGEQEEPDLQATRIAWEVGPDGIMRKKGGPKQEEKDPLDVEEFF